jgi:hypothetical protein
MSGRPQPWWLFRSVRQTQRRRTWQLIGIEMTNKRRSLATFSPGSQTPFGNRIRETPFCRTRFRVTPGRETEFPEVRSQTEFGNEGSGRK